MAFDQYLLKDLPVSIIDGDRGKAYPKRSEFTKSGHCLFLNAGNVTSTGFDFSDCSFISEERHSLLRKGTLQRGDSVLTTRGTVGNVSFYGDSVPFETMRINSGMVIFRCDESVLDPLFFYWFLRSSQFSSQVELLTTGSAQPQLPIRDIKEISASLPQLVEQKAIANVIATLDDKIELNRKTNETLEGIAKALFKSWFVDFDPVKAKAEGRPTGLPDEISELFPDSFEESELGEIPSGWSVGEIGDFLDLERDSVTPSDNGEEMFDHYSIPAYDEGLTPSCEAGQLIKSNKYLVTDGVFMVSKLNPRFPRIWVPSKHITRRRICSTEFLVCRPKVKIDAPFVLHVTKSRSVVQQMSDLASGTSNSHQRVRPADFVGLPFVKPSAALVKLFSEMVGPMLEKHLLTRDENQALSKTRDTLLPRLISGELRVPDAEKMLEEAGV